MTYSSNKFLFVTGSVIVLTVILDTSITKLNAFIAEPIDPTSNVIIFAVIAAVYAVGQNVLLRYVTSKISVTKILKQQFHMRILHKTVSVTQYALVALLVVAIIQMVLFSEYNSIILTVTLGLSYILALYVLVLLANRFFSWFKLNRNSIVLSYGIAIAMLSVNVAVTLVYLSNILFGEYTQYINILPHVGSVQAFALTSDPLYLAYSTSSVISFVATWFATTLLLRHYSKKLGKAKYWIVISIPLIYFLGQFQPFFLDIFSGFREANPITFSIVYTFFFAISKPIGGILFGIAFWSIARTLQHDNALRDFLLISAYGFVFLFTSNQGIIIVNYPYPPFGLVTVSIVGLSSYLVLVGIYSSAVSVAHDVKLRQTVKAFATKEFKLVDIIGTSYMEKEIQKRVIDIASKNQEIMKEQTGIEPSLGEEDVKQYIQEVLREVKRMRSTDVL
jgi:hypothetical protein